MLRLADLVLSGLIRLRYVVRSLARFTISLVLLYDAAKYKILDYPAISVPWVDLRCSLSLEKKCSILKVVKRIGQRTCHGRKSPIPAILLLHHWLAEGLESGSEIGCLAHRSWWHTRRLKDQTSQSNNRGISHQPDFSLAQPLILCQICCVSASKAPTNAQQYLRGWTIFVIPDLQI